MKNNKKIADLTMKLDYLRMNQKNKEEIIKICTHPLRFFLRRNYLTRKVNENYEKAKRIREEMYGEEVEQKRLLEEHNLLYKDPKEAEEILKERHLSYSN